MDTKSARAPVLALLLIASVAVGGIGVGNATADTVAVEVTVLTQNGNSVGGATLNATWDGGSTTSTTASNGRTYLDVPDDKRVEIDVQSNSYVRNEPYVIENPGDVSADGVEIEVYADALATITVENTQGNAVPNAQVNLSKNGYAVIDGETDQNGQIESDYIEVGTDTPYELTVSKRGYLRNTTTLEVQGHVRPTVTLQRGQVQASITVVDRYFDPAQPIENVTVQVGSITTSQTLSNGAQTFQVPVNSQPTVTLSKPGYRSSEATLFVEESSITETFQISRAPDLTVNTSAARVVVGENVEISVTDEYNDRVANATVTLGEEEVGTTNAQGRLTIPIESPGEQTITVSAKGVSESVTVTGFDPDATDTPSPTTETSTTPDSDDTGSAFGPGFGPLLALVGLLALAALAGRRRQ
mgnify:CR=1 FL=1